MQTGNITMISANTVTVNEIISDITVRIQDELKKSENNKFKIKMGSITGSRFLAGRGPDIEVQISTIGNIDTRIKIRIFIKWNKSNSS